MGFKYSDFIESVVFNSGKQRYEAISSEVIQHTINFAFGSVDARRS